MKYILALIVIIGIALLFNCCLEETVKKIANDITPWLVDIQ